MASRRRANTASTATLGAGARLVCASRPWQIACGCRCRRAKQQQQHRVPIAAENVIPACLQAAAKQEWWVVLLLVEATFSAPTCCSRRDDLSSWRSLRSVPAPPPRSRTCKQYALAVHSARHMTLLSSMWAALALLLLLLPTPTPTLLLPALLLLPPLLLLPACCASAPSAATAAVVPVPTVPKKHKLAPPLAAANYSLLGFFFVLASAAAGPPAGPANLPLKKTGRLHSGGCPSLNPSSLSQMLHTQQQCHRPCRKCKSAQPKIAIDSLA